MTTTNKLNRYTVVSVTAEDIARGEPGYATKCPVALAILRLLIPNCTVTVGGPSHHVVFIQEGEDLGNRFAKIRRPPMVNHWLLLYDRSRSPRLEFKPFSFKLRIPQRFLSSRRRANEGQ